MFRTLTKKKEIKKDLNTGIWFHRDTSIDECRGIDIHIDKKQKLKTKKSNLVSVEIPDVEQMKKLFSEKSLYKTNSLPDENVRKIKIEVESSLHNIPAQRSELKQVWDLTSDVERDDTNPEIIEHFDDIFTPLKRFESNPLTPLSQNETKFRSQMKVTDTTEIITNKKIGNKDEDEWDFKELDYYFDDDIKELEHSHCKKNITSKMLEHDNEIIKHNNFTHIYKFHTKSISFPGFRIHWKRDCQPRTFDLLSNWK